MTQLFKFMSRVFKLVFRASTKMRMWLDSVRSRIDKRQGNPTWQHSSAAPLAPLAGADHGPLARRRSPSPGTAATGRRVPRLRRRALPGDRRAGIARGRHLDHDAGQAPAAEGRAHHRRGLAGRWHQRAGRAGGRAGHAGPGAIPNLKNVIDQGVYRRTGPPMRSAPAITRWASSTTRARSSSRRPAGRTCGGPNTPARWPCPRPPIPRACLSCSSWRASGRWIRPTWPRSTPSSPRWTRRCFDSSGAATNAYQSGEAVIGAHFNVGAWDLIDKGLPIGFAVPKAPGPPTPGCTWSRARRTRPPRSLIDTALTPQAAACLAQRLYLGPAVKNTQVPPTWRASCPGAPKARCRT